MTKKRNGYLLCMCIALGLFAVGIGIASFLDWKISQSLFVGENAFSDIFTITGKLPAYGVVAFASAILLASAKTLEKGKNFFSKRNALITLYSLAVFGASAMTMLSMMEDFFEGKLVYLISCFLGLSMAIIIASRVFKMNPQKIDDNKKWAFFAVVTIATVVVFVAGIKLCWGRTRFIDLQGVEGFTAWYIPQGFTGNKSLPSGHTALACCIFTLIPYFENNVLKKKSFISCVILASLSVLFISAVVVSRISSGNHFLSDTMVSILITTVAFFCWSRAFFSKNFDNYAMSEKFLLRKF